MFDNEPLTSLETVADPNHSALIVVDAEHGFCSTEGALARRFGFDLKQIQECVPRLNQFIYDCRNARIPVIRLRELLSDGKMHPNQKTIWESGDDIWLIPEGGRGTDWYARMTKPLPNEPEVTKWHYDGFIDTDLDLVLRRRGIKTLLMTGFNTDMCVGATARHGYQSGYYVIVVSDCTGAPTQEEYDAGIIRIKTYFGHVSTSSELVTVWTDPKGNMVNGQKAVP